jgi:hypothetical protein
MPPEDPAGVRHAHNATQAMRADCARGSIQLPRRRIAHARARARLMGSGCDTRGARPASYARALEWVTSRSMRGPLGINRSRPTDTPSTTSRISGGGPRWDRVNHLVRVELAAPELHGAVRKPTCPERDVLTTWPSSGNPELGEFGGHGFPMRCGTHLFVDVENPAIDADVERPS